MPRCGTSTAPGRWPRRHRPAARRAWERSPDQPPANVGIELHSCEVKDVASRNIQFPETISTIIMASTFGTNVSVISWIWVTVWISETSTPNASAVRSSGPASLLASNIALVTISRTWESVTTPRPPAYRIRPASSAPDHGRDEGPRQQAPPVDQHEQQQLERQRHEDRR